ncbi:protoporphyrinogen oxidase [Ornithinimicrobium humiphilum]|uniref:Coproporphyrinogen III oxidase n=1 Tax=Ornithinimicrobium humiphilum TaxID=125288 RepID=A0A543KNH1_9MICO|nr:protoporphyrinogen oxidase [Ornithinimicrobium humiphilum]TQM96619.1 oxygen-dependent protoporphyrinogen oxidase [Ornithinimicrobium humiphilum]
MTSYLVLGAGISGLTAADDLLRADPAAEVTVLEGADRVGGKLRGERVAGRRLDVGAEAVLFRRPEAMEMIDRAGLAADVVHPTAARAQIWSRGRLHPLPARTVMGVPADPADLHGLLTEDEVSRAATEVVAPVREPDVSVGELVASRLGRAVVDRLVEPLLGGVYAGHADLLSAASSIPALLAAAQAGEPLLSAAGRMVPPPPRSGAAPVARHPVFATVSGGLHRLPEALAARLVERGARVVTGTLVRELHHTDDGGWTVVTGPRPAPITYRADRVVLALPAAPAARLLARVAPDAAEQLASVETASTAVITLAYRSEDVGVLGGSGFLVPPVDGRSVKASTFSATKWDWVAEAGEGAAPGGGDLTFLRLSVGRHREESSLQVDDDELVRLSRADLSEALGRELPAPVDAHVQRWGGALPQYAVGHQARVAAVRHVLAGVPGLVACGAVYDGVGVPACIQSAHRAVEQLLA